MSGYLVLHTALHSVFVGQRLKKAYNVHSRIYIVQQNTLYCQYLPITESSHV